MAVRLAVIDYDTGNLHSACKGLEFAGAAVTIVTSPADLDDADGLVLPGDGAFDPAMQELRSRGFEDPIRTAIRNGIPFLGICIGLQLLLEGSDEGSEQGLGVIPGWVRRFQPESGLTIPHMGWNQLHLTDPGSVLWHGLSTSPWAYFVHSYYADTPDPSWQAAMVTHGHQTVVAALAKDHVMATQFHPEKSGSYGLQMLKNFVDYVASPQHQLVGV